ncbi:MAG TPA: OmpA family protein [Bacteroidales bacterium]|nr:OmpA family protein [Bacteroidales bacterium]
MRSRIFPIIVLFASCITAIQGQSENYYVRRAPFSSDIYDEFSPVFYKSGIVFCSNRNQKVFSGYYTSKKKPFFRIFYADTSKNTGDIQLLAGEINSNLNNGPVSFNASGDTVYFSRNLVVKGSFNDIAAPENKLGLYFAALREGKWDNITELRFNDPAWNVTTPSLSPDGRRLYFASDKADGSGGSDIYFSDWENGYWNNPVNLGPIVNTAGNEAYPFVNAQGELFFSSDGHPGKGAKDIFFTKEIDSAWIKPIALAAPINSKGNDFGLVTDNTMSMGYFSTDRTEKLDIYYFKTVYPQFLYCEKQNDNRYCRTFNNDGVIDDDPLLLSSAWDFGNGNIISGYSATFCFEKPGKYIVKQDIIDRKTGRIVFNKLTAEVEVSHDGLPYIISDDYAVAGNKTILRSEPDSPGFETLAYYWDFNNTGSERNKEAVHLFSEAGNYQVKLMTDVREKETGKIRQTCISKSINVIDSSQKITKHKKQKTTDLGSKENINVRNIYSAATEISKKAFYAVQIMISEKNVSVDDNTFYKVAPQYQIKAIWLPEKKAYSYIIAEETSFMAAYRAYREAIGWGFKNAVINTFLPQTQGESDIWNFKRTYGTRSDQYFFNNGSSISPNAADKLDRLVLLLKRNPEIKMMVVAYTEKNGDELAGIELSSKQAKAIVNYLVNAGIQAERLTSNGYGSAHQIAESFPESERIKNRRIDFIVIN